MQEVKRKIKKMLMRILIDVLIIIFFLTIIIGWRSIMPPKMPVRIYPSDLGLPYEKVYFKNSDGKRLSGWLILSKKSSSIIICLHGYPANKSDILPVVSFLYPEFSLFLFDFRAHGESEGKITYFGLREYLDVKAALDFLLNDKRTKNLNIGIWGYSLGGAVGIIASSKYKEIKALITDSAFANFPEMVTHYYKNFGPAKYIFSSLSKFLGKYILRADFTLNSPEMYIDKIKCPILIIHSKQDNFVPFSHAERLYEKAPSPKELMVRKGIHTGLDAAYSEEYRNKVKNFFKKYLIREVNVKKEERDG